MPWPSLVHLEENFGCQRRQVVHEEVGCDLKFANLKGILCYCFHDPATLQDWGRWSVLLERQYLTEGLFSWHIFQQSIVSSLSHFFSLTAQTFWNFPKSFQHQDIRWRLLVLVSDIRLWSLPDAVLPNLILLILWDRCCCAHLPCLKLRLISAYQVWEDLNPC